MDYSGIDMLLATSRVWAAYIKRAKLRHVEIVSFIADNGPASLIIIANAVRSTPEAVRRDLKKLGESTARGAPGDRLIEKVRFEDRKGLFFQLTARGRLAVREAEAAQEEDESCEFRPDEDDDMLLDWMASRSLVRG